MKAISSELFRAQKTHDTDTTRSIKQPPTRGSRTPRFVKDLKAAIFSRKPQPAATQQQVPAQHQSLPVNWLAAAPPKVPQAQPALAQHRVEPALSLTVTPSKKAKKAKKTKANATGSQASPLKLKPRAAVDSKQTQAVQMATALAAYDKVLDDEVLDQNGRPWSSAVLQKLAGEALQREVAQGNIPQEVVDTFLDSPTSFVDDSSTNQFMRLSGDRMDTSFAKGVIGQAWIDGGVLASLGQARGTTITPDMAIAWQQRPGR